MPSMSQHTQVTALCVTCHLGADHDPGVPGGRGPGGGGGLLPLQTSARQCHPRDSWSIQVVMTRGLKTH